MRAALAYLLFVATALLGSVAGHYHGKAEVYGEMFDHQAILAELVND
jgi:hypothetical protein